MSWFTYRDERDDEQWERQRQQEIDRVCDERTAKLQARIRWLEEGLRAIAGVAIFEPATASGRQAYADPQSIRDIANHYLEGK